MGNKINIYSKNEIKMIRKISKLNIVPFISFSVICLGPIINFFLNVNNQKIFTRGLILILCLIMLPLCWLIYYVLNKQYKSNMEDIEQLINDINDELNSQ